MPYRLKNITSEKAVDHFMGWISGVFIFFVFFYCLVVVSGCGLMLFGRCLPVVLRTPRKEKQGFWAHRLLAWWCFFSINRYLIKTLPYLYLFFFESLFITYRVFPEIELPHVHSLFIWLWQSLDDFPRRSQEQRLSDRAKLSQAFIGNLALSILSSSLRQSVPLFTHR